MAVVWANATVAYKILMEALLAVSGVTLAMPGEIDPDIQEDGAIARVVSFRAEHTPRNAADGEADEAKVTLVVAVLTKAGTGDPRNTGAVYAPMRNAELVASALDQLHGSDNEGGHDLYMLRPSVELLAGVDEETGFVFSTVTISGSLTRSAGSGHF